jgi:ABC-type multidrug transport system ATPase subunit
MAGLLETDRLSLRGPRGWVYRDVTFAAASGELVAVEGAPGSGRTSLLLTLAGRMKPSSGSARIDGHRLPDELYEVQRIAALGLVPGVSALEPGLSVVEQFRERELLSLRFRTSAQTVAALEAWLGVPATTLVRDLDALRKHLLGVAMALIGSPRLIVADDVDVGMRAADQVTLWEHLALVARRGITVLASCSDAAPAADVADVVVRLHAHSRNGNAPL